MKRPSSRQLGAALLITCGVIMALGAVGHSVMTGPRIQSDLAASRLNSELQHLLMAVWHFGGACMVLLGGLVAFTTRRPALGPVALAIAFLYVAFGLVAWAWASGPFFAIFTALGLGVLGGLRLSRGPSGPGWNGNSGAQT